MGPEAGASGRALSVAELKKLTAQRIGSAATGGGAQHSAHPTHHYQPTGNGGHAAHRAALPGQHHRGYGHPNAHHSAGYAPRPAPAPPAAGALAWLEKAGGLRRPAAEQWFGGPTSRPFVQKALFQKMETHEKNHRTASQGLSAFV